MKIIKNACCLLLAALLGGAAGAQVHTPRKPNTNAVRVPAQVLPLDPAVRYGKLPNGFTYYIRHNETPKNRVLLYLVNKAGSILEDEDQRGLAHFMEHMSFNGTKHYPHNQLEDYLQKAGVRFGADLNAYTSFDETVYQLPIPSDKPEVLSSGIQIMRDWAHDVLLDPQEIEKERGVVLEEERLGKGAEERMRRVYFPMLLNQSRYAQRLPIGLDAVLKNFKRPVIARFYNDWYRPNLQALIIVGDVNVNEIEKTVKAKFGDLKNPTVARPRTPYTVPLTGKNQFLALTDKEQSTTDAQVIFKFPQQKMQTAADLRVFVLRYLFNKMLNDRYTERTLSAEPPYISCSSGISGFLGGLDAFTVHVVAKPGQLQKGFEAAWEEVVRLKQYGFTQAELDRAKKSYIRALETQMDERDKTNSDNYVKEYQQHFLKGTAAPGIEAEYELARNDVNDITLKDVNGMPAQYIKAANRDILVQAPASEKNNLPDERTVNAWLTEVDGRKPELYQEKAAESHLLTSEPTPGKIIAEKTDTQLGFTMLKFSNGVTAILKPTDFKNDEIMFSSFARGGTSLYPDADYQSAANAVALVTAGGVGNFDITGLRQYLSDKKVTVQPYLTELYQGVAGKTSVRDLTAGLQLTYAYFTQPRKNAAMFSNIISRSQATLSNRGNDPKNVFQDSMLATFFNNNPRKTGPSVDKLKLISLDRGYEIYQQRFGDAAGQTFVFVGSFTVEQIKPLLETYIGSLPASEKQPNFEDRHTRMAQGVIEKNIYKGAEPRATVTLTYSGSYNYSRQANMELEALKESLQIRVLERLREEEGGVYSPQVAVSNSKYPVGAYLLQISFACSPQNVDKLIASANDEVAKLRADGPLQVNIDKWKAQLVNQVDSQLKENSFWLAYLSGQVQNDMGLQPVNEYKQVLEKISRETLKEAANKYLNGKNYIRLVLMPENTAAGNKKL